MRLGISLGKLSHQLPIWSTANMKGQVQALGLHGFLAGLPAGLPRDLLGAHPLLREGNGQRTVLILLLLADA